MASYRSGTKRKNTCPMPAHLERRTIIIEPGEDTSGYVKIGEEVTEELEYEPSRLYDIKEKPNSTNCQNTWA